ncbi:hypothetical protein BDFB_010265 [Asbolus verrucosus]|uniref:Male-enhanced antigen 1 n=1 Tax=Asbolus verrucosus TaxID=1661398 RepID=A0A482W8S2_ASBVE|nr:hypothetical protein BDFB_010265 [Asbolus verrucosus]
MVADADTDEEDSPHNEYQPLPMHEMAEVSDDDLNSDSEEAAGISNEDSLPSITRIEDALVKEVWMGPAPKAVDIEMDNNKVDEVKQAMMNFTLPPSSIPEWANNIPEEQWKQQLISRLQYLQKKGKE